MITREHIIKGQTILGIELGSTRIKAVLIDANHTPIAVGSHDWENHYVDGIWTYSLDEVWMGIQSCYKSLTEDVRKKYNVELTKIKSLGISGMMHGYMAFNQEEKLLVPFRTWRNTITEEAANQLTKLFDFPVPQRWSIAHLYQAMLNGEEHVKDVSFFTTLSGYVHWKLTGKKVLGIGEASGMFPVDVKAQDWNRCMIGQFNDKVSQQGFDVELENLLPRVLTAGTDAGVLTETGAMLLDPTGKLQPGVPMCPPEGDAGTGMVATNSVKQRTGNISVGTSVFSMIVMQNELKKVHEEIDLVTTPSGELVAMVHGNNCTSDLNSWIGIFEEFADSIGAKIDKNELYSILYHKAMEGEQDCGGLLSYNYLSGEHITGFEEGRPLFVRTAESKFNLANFMRTHLYSSLGVLKIGMDILLKEEDVQLEEIYGHGGFFKTKGVGQSVLASALNTSITVLETAGEGGAWGVAVLAAYLMRDDKAETLGDYLASKVFVNHQSLTVKPEAQSVRGFEEYIARYIKGLPIERAAIEFFAGGNSNNE